MSISESSSFHLHPILLVGLSILLLGYPVGGAIGQIISPLVQPTRLSVSAYERPAIHQTVNCQQILVLGIVSTAVLPAIFLISDAPPTPPSKPFRLIFEIA
jgi:FLVCR family MFS transporter 7